MLRTKDILDEKSSKMLRTISKDVEFPMSEDDIFLINSMIQYLRLSQDEEYALKYNIRAGMGLSAVQLGVLKRFFVVSYSTAYLVYHTLNCLSRTFFNLFFTFFLQIFQIICLRKLLYNTMYFIDCQDVFSSFLFFLLNTFPSIIYGRKKTI